MRYTPITKVEEGMILGQHICSGEGRILLEQETKLMKEDVQRLFQMGLPGIYTEDDISWDLRVPRLISRELERGVLGMVNCLFREEDFLEIEQESIQETAKKMTRQILAGRDKMYHMVNVRVADDYTFFHSVNVAALSVMLGVKTGNLDLEQLNKLAAAALLHDVGKRYVEADVLNAKRSLTEEERILVVQHPKLSYDFLTEHYDFAPEVCDGVLEHHEWYNGCGYPMRRSGYEISYFARIIKVADVFDALTSKLPYHDPISPSGAVDYILGNTGSEFDPDLAELFTGKIAIYPTGCEVMLSDGRTALVTENDPEYMLRPRVMTLPDGEMIDLKSQKDLAVLELFV